MKARLLACSLTLSLLLAGSVSAMGAQTDTLGAKLSPSVLTMNGREVKTRIQNLGTIPVLISADARLSSLTAPGYRVTVDPPRLEPREWATVTMRRQKTTPPADVALSIGMAPETRAGTDSTALRFPVPVTDPDKTSLSTLAARLLAWGWTLGAPL